MKALELMNLLGKDNKNNKAPNSMDYGRALEHFIAQDSVNKYDNFGEVLGLSTQANAVVKELLDRSEFAEKIERLGYELSKGDFQYALITYLIDGQAYIDYAIVAESVSTAGKLTLLSVHTQETFLYNDINQPVYNTWWIEKGKVLKGQKIVVNGIAAFIDEPMEYPGTEIPAKLMYNNSLRKPDIPNDLKPMLANLTYFGNEFSIEWRKVRTQYMNNMLYNSKPGSEYSEDMKKGVDMHDVNDPDGKLANSLQLMTSGSQSMVLLMNQVDFLEDKILKFSFTMRETISTGTNKGALEVSGINQAEYEYMTKKLNFRLKQMNRFFDILFKFMKEAGLLVNQPKNYSIDLVMSDLERYKQDNMRVSIEEKQAQANQWNAIANKQNAEATNLSKPVEKTEIKTGVE